MDIKDLNNVTFDLSSKNLSKATKIYTIADVIGLADSTKALTISEAKKALNEFSNSYLSKANEKIQPAIQNINTALTSLDIVTKTVEIYRVAKPAVKLAVNIGGIVFNFANTLEIAQDALSLAFRYAVGEGKKLLEELLINFLRTPLFATLGDEETNIAIIDKYREFEEEYREFITEFLLNITLDDYLELVRAANDYVLRSETITEETFSLKTLSDIEITDVFVENDTLYISTNTEIIKIDGEEEEILEETTNIKKIHVFNNELYYLIENGSSTDLYSNTDGFIESFFGTPIKLFDYENNLIVVTTLTTQYGISAFTEIRSGETIDCVSSIEGLFISSSTQIFKAETVSSIVELVCTTPEGIISSIAYYSGNIYFSYIYNNIVKIASFITQEEFKYLEGDEYGFSFVKILNGKNIGYKNKSLYEITITGGTFTTDVLVNNLPGDISDLEYIDISGTPYYIAALGESIFVSDTGMKYWEEKSLNFSDIGETPKLITGLYYDSTYLYVSVMNKLARIEDFSYLIPQDIIPDEDILPIEPIDVESGYTTGITEGDSDLIPVVLIKTFDDIIYHIHTPSIISAGKKIYNIDTVEFSGDNQVYNFSYFNGRYFIFQGKNLFIDEEKINSIENEKVLISTLNTGTNLYIFSEDACLSPTGNSSFVKQINSKIPLYNRCSLVSDGSSLLIADDKKITNFILSEKEIKELVQILPEIEFVKISGNKIFVICSNGEIYWNEIESSVSQDTMFHNGYKINTHYEKGVGIAPFDNRSRVIQNLLINKSNYISSMDNEFEEHFRLLMKNIPNALTTTLLQKFSGSIGTVSENPSNDEKSLLKILENDVKETINKLLDSFMKQNFRIGMNESERFKDNLLETLSEPGKSNITYEFYYLAFNFVKDTLSNVAYELNGYNLWALVLEYYNNHKDEWGDLMKRYVSSKFIPSSQYGVFINTNIESELSSLLDALLNTTCMPEIQSIISGKSGEITEADKQSLIEVITTKFDIKTNDAASYTDWISTLSDAVTTVYIPNQQIEYENAIDDATMEPIAWEELPSFVNRTAFLNLLNSYLDIIREQIKNGIQILVNDGEVPCFSCVNPSIVYKDVERKIDILLKVAKSRAKTTLEKTTTYEAIPASFYIIKSIPSLGYLREILDNQSNLYATYLGEFIDVIIEQSGADGV